MSFFKIALKKLPQIFTEKEYSDSRLYYDKYWENKGSQDILKLNPFQEYRANYIIQNIEDNSSMLDIGTGEANILKKIITSKKINATGSDISDHAKDRLNSIGIEHLNLDLSDIDSIRNINNFDYIIILEVLEHIPNSEEVLVELLKKTNKALFYSFPNTGFFIDRLRLLFGRFPQQWRHHPSEHLRFWTYKDVKWMHKNLKISEYSTIHAYAGIPFLNKILKNLFAEAIIVKINK
jgi:methionine biosynthesis protein MetW